MTLHHGLATSTATLCFVYVVILDLFRITVFENESVIESIGEALLCSGLVAAAFYSSRLSNPTEVYDQTEVYVQSALTVFSCVYAYRMKKFYVSGMKYTTENLDGKVYIITGSNTGLGFETAKHIVLMGGTVILACRSVVKAALAKDSILHTTKCAPTKVVVIKLDLCGFDSVRKFVKEFRSLSLPLNGLINNAGVMMPERVLTQDGFETVFTANHLSHFLLTNLLLSELEKTSGRVINVTSTLHKSLTSFNFDDVMSVKNYSLFGTYSQSKLANILFTTELQKR
jgi:sulfur transfer complex TusBCD TusB component (DsrH family)